MGTIHTPIGKHGALSRKVNFRLYLEIGRTRVKPNALNML